MTLPDPTCACLPARRAEIERLIAASGEHWIHVEGHGHAYAATEDQDYTLPICDPCYGAVGPYSAVWHAPALDMYRCSGCLEWALLHPEDAAAELEAWQRGERWGSTALSRCASWIRRWTPDAIQGATDANFGARADSW